MTGRPYGGEFAAASCCYGKIPTLGDFIHRGLSQRQIDAWDEWLQGCISESRRQLADRWLDYYLEAPVWFFALGRGNIDQQGWIGIWIPSVDRVGRYFPFSVIRPFGGGTPLDAMRGARDWFSAAETLALDCLEEDFAAERLEARLADLPLESPHPELAESPFDSPIQSQAFGRLFRLGDAPSTNQVLSTIADDSLLQLHPTYSVWWTAGSSAVEAALLISGGMPNSGAFTSMLDGRFTDGGWAGGRRIPSGAPAQIESTDTASQLSPS